MATSNFAISFHFFLLQSWRYPHQHITRICSERHLVIVEQHVICIRTAAMPQRLQQVKEYTNDRLLTAIYN